MKKKQNWFDAVKKYIKGLEILDVARFCLTAFFIFLPFQINFLVYEPAVYESGFFNPYTVFCVSLSDIFFILAVISVGIAIFRDPKKVKITIGDKFFAAMLLVFLILVELSFVFSGNILVSFFAFLKFVEAFVIYIFVVSGIVTIAKLVPHIVYVIALEAVLGCFQYFNQGSVGFGLIGEPLISPEILGVAKVDIGGEQLVRSYGTFPHPNMLGGFLVFGMLFSLPIWEKRKFLCPVLFAFMALAIILTFSRSAWIAIILGLVIFFGICRRTLLLKNLFIGLLIFLVFIFSFGLDKVIYQRIFEGEETAVAERVEYMDISKEMLIQNPFGVGLANFTLEMQDYSDKKLSPWEYQPVHNIFILLANETGIITMLFFVFLMGLLIWKVFPRIRCFTKEEKYFGCSILAFSGAIIVIGLFDHYLISLYRGFFLLWLLFIFAGRFLAKECKA